jgi:hypothetical protein
MEEDFINILGADEIDTLFGSEETPEKETQEESNQESDASVAEEENSETVTTEVKGALFEGDSEPESVGSEASQEGEEEGSSTDDSGGTSPNNNFYSSMANAAAEDGIFPNLDEETINKAVDAESFSELIEAEINARLDERQQRVAKALDNGVEPTDIRKYENTLQYISSITEQQLAEESEKGEQLRRNLIYQDFINRGYTQERAQKLTERTIDAGTDVEDAKEALQNNRDFFQNAYNKLL